MSKKQICDVCNYETYKLSNYNKHITTKKHKLILEQTATDKVPVDSNTLLDNDTSKKKLFQCEFCAKILSYKQHLICHYAVCTEKEKDNVIKRMQKENQVIIDRLQEEKEQLLKEKELEIKEKEDALKKTEEAFKKIEEVTKLKEKAEKNYIDELKEFRAGVKSGSITVNNTNNTNNNNVNIGKLNVYYVVKNFNDAYNYEDLMAPALTKAEIRHARNYGPSAGCEKLIMNRCVNGISKDKRPIHCVDASREKFMVKTKGEWELDVDKDDILKPAFAHMRTQYDISEDNKDIMDKVKNLQLLQEMDTIGGKKTIKHLVKKTLLKNKD